MSSLSRSWGLVKQSYAVLRQDKELIWFPILSGIGEILIIISFVWPMMYFMDFDLRQYERSYNVYVNYFILFLFYLVNFFVVTFFNAGLVYCAHKRLMGGDPTFKEGITYAVKNLPKILTWVLLAATVGTILRIIADKVGILGKIFSGLAGIVWSLVTYLIVPILIFENKSVLDSAKYSVELFKKSWGEQISGSISMNIIFMLLGLMPLVLVGGVVYFMFSSESFSLPILITTSVIYAFYLLTLMIISTSLNGIFTAALYIYAKDGTIPSSFNPELIKGAFKPKNRKEVPSTTPV